MKKQIIGSVFIFLFLSCIIVPALYSQTAWRGTISTNWNTAGNWSAGVPTSTSAVIIGDVSFTYQPSISSADTVASLTFQSAQVCTLTIASGGSLNVTGNVSGSWSSNRTHLIAIGAQSVTIGGNFTTAESNNRRINTTISTGTMTIGGSLALNNRSIFTISSSGILNVGTNLSGDGTFTSSAAGKLFIGGNNTSTGTFNRGTGTVTYNGTNAQTVRATTYYNLTIAKSAQTATLAGTTTVNGNLTISSGTLAASTYAMTIRGNFINSGTFTGNTGSVTMAGTNTSISGAGLFNFYTLAITGSGITVDANTSLNIANNLSTSGSGILIHASGGTGSITMTGTTKTISGTGIQLDDLNISGSVTLNSSISLAGNLNVSGTLTGVAGTVLTMNGSGSTISGSGAITLSTLSIKNDVNATANIRINGNLSGGTLTATSGTCTFNGAPSQLSGTANLFKVVINGAATLRLTTNSRLGIADTLTATGSLDAVNGGSPNTVDYNSTGAQNIIATTYSNLSLSNGNTKTAVGSLTVNGNFLIGTGTTFAAGANTHTVQGDWTNNGTFTASSSIVQLTGGSDASIGGSNVTTFSTFTINKNVSTNTVTSNVNINTATLNLTSGNLAMGTNAVTITGTRTGSGIITGTIIHSHIFSAGTAYSFEGPDNTVTFSSGTVSSVSITVTIGSVADFPFGSSVNRQYNIQVTGTSYTATLRLHYLDGELNGNTESTVQLWLFNGGTWGVSGKTANDATNNWVEQSGLTHISSRWTISHDQNVVRWNGNTTNWNTASNWTVVQGSPSTPPSANDVVQIGDVSFINQPAISSAVTIKNIIFSSIQASAITLNPGGSLTVNDISGQWNSNVTHNIDVGMQSLNVNGNLVLSDGISGHTINLIVSGGTINIAGSLTESGNSNITLGSGNITIGGDFNYTNGAFSGGSSTVTYNGSAGQNIGGVSYYNLSINKIAGVANLNSSTTVSGNLSILTGSIVEVNAALNVVGNVNIGASTTMNANASTITVDGNWVRTGEFTSGSSNLVFGGSGSQSIDGTTFNSLTIDKPSGTISLNGALTINKNVTISTGTLDLGSQTANRSILGDIFFMGPNTYLRLSGANNFPSNYSQYLLDSSSTVECYGAGTQTLPGLITHGNLLINKTSGDVVLNNNIAVNGNLNITGGDVDLNGNTIALGNTAMVNETAGNTVKGNGIITGTINLNAPSAVNAFGLGAIISSTVDIGNTVIIRGHTKQSVSGDSSILRYYEINPEVNSGLNATLVFQYDDSELSGLVDSTLCLYRSIDDGISWLKMEGIFSPASKTVTLDSVDEFSMWTLSSLSAITTGVGGQTTNSTIPKEYSLTQNYPNPFNPITSISFDIPKQSHVVLKIYDIIGREITTLVHGDFSAGRYIRTWNASSFSSGVYFYRIDARETIGNRDGKYTSTRKLLLVK
jgi:hypothetical protein